MSEKGIVETVINIPAGVPTGYACFFVAVDPPNSKIGLDIAVGQLPTRQDLDISCFIVTRDDFDRWSEWVDSEKSSVRRPDIRVLYHRRSTRILEFHPITEAGEYAVVLDNTHSVMTVKRVWVSISLE